ncbi:hypothetical protein N0V90_011738 [Kalmusia sp. IMI 367209]|nr:hypothetical protein N0V90_011738 [Kalmusia sp. IMI 367209]
MSHSIAPNSSPQERVNTAINADSTSQLLAALESAASGSITAFQELLNSSLAAAVSKGSVELTKCILDEGAEVSALNIFDVASRPSIALFEVLNSYGYNFNQQGAKDSIMKGRSLIYKVLHDATIVEWLINHGASVDIGEEQYEVEARPPLLLETCAALGSVSSFKRLKDHGAKVPRRALHVAVGEAAALGANPNNILQKDSVEIEDEKHKIDREEMLRYLVDDLRLDVNALDCDEYKFKFWGPPLNYAAKEQNGGAVVHWLLGKGADPNNSSTGGMTTEQMAKTYNAKEVLMILEDRK